MNDPVEWEFGVPASQVDLGRIVGEVQLLPAIIAFSYLNNLRVKAPTVYRLLEKYAKVHRVLGWVEWR